MVVYYKLGFAIQQDCCDMLKHRQDLCSFTPFDYVLGIIMAPKEDHVLIPGTWEYVSLQSKSDLEDMNKLRIFIWGDDSGFPDGITRLL